MTSNQCLFCNCDLSVNRTCSNELSTAFKNKLFNVFCKFLKIQDRCWDFSREDFPFCSNCVCLLEEISFNYDLMASVYDTVSTIYKNIQDIMKESRRDYNDRGDRKMNAGQLKFVNFRENVYQKIQNFQGKSNREESMISILETDEEEEHEEELETDGEGDYFNSFLNKNVKQLWGESLISKRQEQAAKKRKLDYDDDENSTDYEERVENVDETSNDNFNDDDGFQNDNVSGGSDYEGSSGQEENDNSNDDEDDDDSSRTGTINSNSNVRPRTKRGERRLAQNEDGSFTYRKKFPIIKIEESNSYKCGKCPEPEEREQVKSYDMVCDVIEHIERDHFGNSFKYGLSAYFCHICSLTLRGKNKNHVFFLHEKRKVKKNRCRICTFFAPSVEELTTHQSEAHPIIHQEALARRPPPPPPRSTVHQTPDGKWMYRGVEIKTVTPEDGSEEFYICEHCPTKQYATRRKAINHIGKTHIENAVEGRFMYEGVEVVLENGLFSCTLCPDKAPYRTGTNLHTHILDYHKEGDKNSWKNCETCGKEYRTLFQLKNHRKTHQNQRYDIVCDLCGKAFNSEYVLKNHVRHVHEGFAPEKKFLCSQCPKKFLTNTHLLIHMRVHTGEFPFPCPACDDAFRSEKTRRVHWRRKHAEDTPFKCNFCTEAFHDSTFVTAHLKKFHPEVTDRRRGIGYQVIYKPKMVVTT